MHEQYFIGQILKDPDIAFKTSVKDSDFLSNKCRIAFITIRSMLQEGLNVDLSTIISKNSSLKASDLIEMQDTAITTGNWKFYEGKVKEAARRRIILRACEDALKSKQDSQAIIEDLNKAIDGYRDFGDYRITSIQDTLLDAVDYVEYAYHNRGKIAGVDTGIQSLNRKINGFQKRRLYVIGARPSDGKTALLVNFLGNSNTRAGFISAESGQKELTMRLISLKGHLNSEQLTRGDLGQRGFDEVHRACEVLNEKEVYFYDEPNIDIETLSIKAREMKQRFDIQILFVDYIQQIDAQARTDHERVGKVSTKLKGIARDLDIPVVAAAQLRRPDPGSKKAPELHDLGNSGQIERDADIVMMIQHTEEDGFDKTYLILEKNRDGAKGRTQLLFKREYYGFYDMEKGYE
jgi:replicative DNA helicase